jgi:hypothetical protein
MPQLLFVPVPAILVLFGAELDSFPLLLLYAFVAGRVVAELCGRRRGRREAEEAAAQLARLSAHLEQAVATSAGPRRRGETSEAAQLLRIMQEWR